MHEYVLLQPAIGAQGGYMLPAMLCVCLGGMSVGSSPAPKR
jgi:hypothetical protein